MIKPFDQKHWNGRTDVEDGMDGKRWHQLVSPFEKSQATFLDKAVVFLGFSSDEGVRRNFGRLGARKAPNTIRKYLSGLPRHDSDVSHLFDYGNVICVGKELEEARAEQIDIVSSIIKKKAIPVVLGGGHETSLGNFKALSHHHKNIGIINIDAHFDLRLPYPDSTSGTGFYEMAQFCKENDTAFNYFCLGVQEVGNTRALFNRAKELNVKYATAEDLYNAPVAVWKDVEAFIESVDAIFLTVDMDAIDVSYAPGVSAPCSGGLQSRQVKELVRKIAQSGKTKIMDIVEVNPEYDVDDRTSRLAAYLVSEAVHNF